MPLPTSQASLRDDPSTYHTPAFRHGELNRTNFNPSKNVDCHHHSNHRGPNTEPRVKTTGGLQQHHLVDALLKDPTDIFNHPMLKYIEGMSNPCNILALGAGPTAPSPPWFK